MRTSFPTLPASQTKWEKGIARALKRIMGRQGVIMALASNPLNSLKTREGGKRQKGARLLATCRVNLASRAAERGGGEGRTGHTCHPALTAWSIRDAGSPAVGAEMSGQQPPLQGKRSNSKSTGICFPPLLPGPRRAPLRESVVFAQQGEAEILEVAGKGAARGVLQESLGTPISMRSRGQRSASSLAAGQAGSSGSPQLPSRRCLWGHRIRGS